MSYDEKELTALFKRLDWFTEHIMKLEERRDEAEDFLKNYDRYLADARKTYDEITAEIDAMLKTGDAR